MVARRERAGDEHGRQSRRGELPDRAAGPRQRDVGRAVGDTYLVHERLEDVVGTRRAAAQVGVVALAAEVDDGGAAVGPGVERQVVEEPRAERPAEDQYDARVRGEPEPAACLLAGHRPRGGRDRAADRTVLLPVPADRQREKDAFHERRGEPICQAEMRIRLGERARDSLDAGGQRHRPRHVAAGAEHGVGPAPPEDAAAGSRSGERLPHCPHELEVGPPRQPRDRERVELVAALRNEPRFDAIRRPGERHQSAPPPQRLRDRERRRDVSHRPAGRDQEPQLPLVRHYGRC